MVKAGSISGEYMMVRINKNKDFFAGLMFVLFGAFAMIVARNYPMGTSSTMGPGYFPTVLGGGLVLLGLITAVRALLSGSKPIELFAPRPLLLTLSSLLVFGIILEPFGLIVAVLALVCLARLAGQEFRLWEVIILALVLTASVMVIFVYGLGMTVKVWPV